MATHSETLGIDPTASHEEVVKAYFRATSGSRKAGFLIGSSQSKAERKAIEAAYQVLVDAGRRAAYDASLRTDQ